MSHDVGRHDLLGRSNPAKAVRPSATDNRSTNKGLVMDPTATNQTETEPQSQLSETCPVDSKKCVLLING